MNVPDSPEQFAKMLRNLKKTRLKAKKAEKNMGLKRQSLSKLERRQVLEKTDGRCHICGGEVGEKWQADHISAHSAGGPHTTDNYLPAHPICNNYRWDYLPEEFEIILKLGVWARTQIDRETKVGIACASSFLKYERSRGKRRK